MKKIITLITLAAASAVLLNAKPALTETTANADSPLITYVGRTLVSPEGAVSFDWCATEARIAFEGNFLSVNVSDTKKNYYNVWIDKARSEEADFVISTFGSDSTIVLFDAPKAKAAAHSVILQKRTEGEQGTTTLHSFTTRGKFVQAEPLKDRLIEVVGDSYTCGYGSENSISTNRFSPETENVNKAYEAVVARYFDADLVTIAHSGMGITRNYNEEVKPHLKGYHMPERYTQVFDESKEYVWDASKSPMKPAVTIIHLGANDFSVGIQPHVGRYVAKYHKLLSEIKANYGEDHPVICVASRNNENLFIYVRQAATTCGMKNVYYTGIFEGVQYNDDRELGADFHPNYQAHIKIAHTIIPYVATATGWEMSGKVIK